MGRNFIARTTALASLLLISVPLWAAISLPIEGASGKTFQVPWDQIQPNHLLVLVNTQDPQSVEVADDYMQRYVIPSANRLNLNFTKEATIRDDEFAPVYNAVQDYLRTRTQIQGIVITWTEPWRVSPSGTSAGMSITNAFTFGFLPEYYNSDGGTCAVTEDNPLFGQDLTAPFTEFGLRPVMMLAGETAQDALAVVDRSLVAKSTFPLTKGYLVRTTDSHRSVRYPQMENANEFWGYSFGLNINYIDNHSGPAANNFVRDQSDVLYYFTGLVQVDYLDTLQFVPGAVADHLTSFGGQLTTSNQMSILRWLEAGASGSYGTVTEPCNSPDKFPNVERFLDRYFRGATLMDAYWQSAQETGEGIFVGDPLTQPYAPKARLNGEGQIELITTGMVEAHLYKVVGVNDGGATTILLNGIHVNTPEMRVLSVPANYPSYKLVDTGSFYSDHGAPVFSSNAVTQLNLADGTSRFDIRATDPENHDIYYTFQLANGQLLQRSADLSIQLVVEGDVNVDGFVNFIDLGIVKSAMWASVGQPNYVSDADLNSDGVINFSDVASVQENFGKTRYFVRVTSTPNTVTTYLTFMAFDKWGSESRVTVRVSGTTLTINY